MLRAIGQLILIAVGYVAAALAASVFLNVVALWSLGWDGEAMPAVMSGSMIVGVPVLAAFVGYYAFVPALVAIAAAEIVSARDWSFHGVAGGAVAGAVVLLMRGGLPAEDDFAFMTDPAFVAALVASGVVGGLVYWAIAGRSSGAWQGTRVSGPGSSGS